MTGQTNKKRAWSWPVYLEEEKAIAAPVKLFKEVILSLNPSSVLSLSSQQTGFITRPSDQINQFAVYVFLAAPVVPSEQEWL